MQKTHIVGMAKTTLSNKSGPLRSLELDFLRLLYFVRKCDNKLEHEIKRVAFLTVFEQKKALVERWFENYGVNIGTIIINSFEELGLTEGDKKKIIFEHELNKNRSNSNSLNRSNIGEKYLLKAVNREYDLKKLEKVEYGKSGIRWDCQFYSNI